VGNRGPHPKIIQSRNVKLNLHISVRFHSLTLLHRPHTTLHINTFYGTFLLTHLFQCELVLTVRKLCIVSEVCRTILIIVAVLCNRDVVFSVR